MKPKDEYVYPRGDAPGIDMRDWFAGMALQGLASKYWSESHKNVQHRDYVEVAYELADMMIEKSKKD